MKKSVQPLSPHLQIYQLTMTMVMSITHRLSGIALYMMMVMLVFWLSALAWWPQIFSLMQKYLALNFGQGMLFLGLWVFTHHLFGGIRHFIWDLGFGLEKNSREWAVWANLILGFIFAVMIFWGEFFAHSLGIGF